MIVPQQRILILCKTYPSPSARYVETSCVAGMTEAGRLVRLFPVPFRLVEDERQFRKWQWIRARVRKPGDDHRPESFRISVDTIEMEGEPLPTRDDWLARRRAIASVEVFDNFADLEAARRERGISLGLYRPSRLTDMQISRATSPEWTEEEFAKLMQAQLQGHLFDQDAELRDLKLLRKLPYDFHYLHEGRDGQVHRHKLVDWEAGALYWNIHRKPDWQALFKQKFLADFRQRDTMFLMGTIHRFPNQWLIVSVLYPPRLLAEAAGQGSLF